MASNKGYYQEYYQYFNHLFLKASQNGGTQYIFTLLRVSGIEDGGWDPFVEAEDALNDFSKILRKESKKGIDKRSLRLALMIYCHSIEMSAPYQIMYNLLRCVQGKQYISFPFPGNSLGKKAKIKKPFAFRPMSPLMKIKILENECKKVKEENLIKNLSSFFNDEMRNAFFHSDYTITDEEFRICDGDIAHGISLEKVSEKLSRCFAFYQAFFDVYKQVKYAFKKVKKYHRLFNFEVFEILVDKKDGLFGFKMHFSNGSNAFFERRKEKVHGVNVMLKKDHINFFVGDLDKLQQKWIVNGKIFREKNTRYNRDGLWKPILFHGKTDEIKKEIESETNDDDIQGCLFYIKCTGHEAIEFVIKSKKKLFDNKGFNQNKIKIVPCGYTKNKNYLYDGTYFVNSIKTVEVKKGLNRIKKFIDNLRLKDKKIVHCLKYHIKSKVKPVKQDQQGVFMISFLMDDPRNTLCTSDLTMLPRADWGIQEDWVE